MGYMVLPRELVKAFTYARSMLDGHTPQILQLTLARFMEDGHYNAHVRAMRKLYAGRQAIMLDAIGKHLGHVVTAWPPGGLQIPCVLHEGWSEEKPSARPPARACNCPVSADCMPVRQRNRDGYWATRP
jgi:GntR family transcriptional regulator/MocR family aminotransferase